MCKDVLPKDFGVCVIIRIKETKVVKTSETRISQATCTAREQGLMWRYTILFGYVNINYNAFLATCHSH